jgi:DNA-binding FadR family transcriptional regulator
MPVEASEQKPPRATARSRRRPEKLSETVAREIVRDIRDLPAGSMLPPETVMLDSYSVGRGSLREALRILEVQGFLVIRPGPGGGPMVAEIDSLNFAKMASMHLHLSKATYREVIEARLVMEPVMARLAAQRQDTDVVAKLEDYVDQPDPVDHQAYLHSATDFHSLVSSMSGNSVLDLYSGSLKSVYADRIESTIFPPEAREKVNQDHKKIARLITQGKASRAESLMREHMEEFLMWSSSRHPGVLDEIVDWR